MQTDCVAAAGKKRNIDEVVENKSINCHSSKRHKSVEEESQLRDNSMLKDDELFPTILPSLSLSPRPAGTSGPGEPNNSNLCKRCSLIDLDSIISGNSVSSYRSTLLSPVDTWEINTCPLCGLLCSTASYSHSFPSRKIYFNTFSTDKMRGRRRYFSDIDKIWSSTSTKIMRVETSERLVVSQPEGTLGPVKIIKETIENFEIVKSWIAFCREKHTKVCRVTGKSFVPGLKLIDCHTGTIVDGKDKSYVALSYV
jgi:hypothetical protein